MRYIGNNPEFWTLNVNRCAHNAINSDAPAEELKAIIEQLEETLP